VRAVPFRFAEILRMARTLDASDVHAAADVPLAFRVDGRLEMQGRQTLSEADIREILAFCFEEKQMSALRERGDSTLTYSDVELGAARVHAYVTRAGISLAIRLLAVDIPQLEALRLPQAATRLAFVQQGLVLVTGRIGASSRNARWIRT